METFLSVADRELSLFLNHFGTPWLDQLMILWSKKWVWIPFYGLLIGWLFRNFDRKKSVLLLLAIGALILLSDQTASALFKPLFQRLRPCHDPMMLPLLRLPDGCGGQFGFASSHAANTMALAVFFALLPYPSNNKTIWTALFCWALLTGWSRVYLGLHFAGDIVGGFFIGAFWAACIHLLLRRKNFFNEKTG